MQVAYSFNLHEICPLLLTPCLDKILRQIPIYNLELLDTLIEEKNLFFFSRQIQLILSDLIQSKQHYFGRLSVKVNS